MRVLKFNKLLSTEFQDLSNLLSETAFAAYLLGYDASSQECQNLVDHANFAEGDDPPKPKKKKKTIVRRLVTAKTIIYPPHGKDQTAAEITAGDRTVFSMRFDVPPTEAIDFFKRKKIMAADKFYELEAEAKSGAFALANVYNTDVAEALRDELIAALENGTPQREVIKRLKDILAGAGHKELGDAHLETVVRTTTQMAYGVGRRKAQEEVADYLPIWRYQAVGDDRTRPTHMALDGLEYPVNHPFWQRYYPPWDYRCRCWVEPLLDYQSGYDRSKPNDRTVISKFDDDGLPEDVGVDGQVKLNMTKRNNFAGVPRQTNLREVLTAGADRALESRNR